MRQLVDGDYWVSRSGAARLLGVSERRVTQLAKTDRLPYAEHSERWRLYRRAQVEVVGNARRLRFAAAFLNAADVDANDHHRATVSG